MTWGSRVMEGLSGVYERIDLIPFPEPRILMKRLFNGIYCKGYTFVEANRKVQKVCVRLALVRVGLLMCGSCQSCFPEGGVGTHNLSYLVHQSTLHATLL